MSKLYNVSMTVELEDDANPEVIEKWENHIDYAIDMKEYPEIKSISNVSVTSQDMIEQQNKVKSSMIVEIFETLLDERDITINCKDEDEEKERQENDSNARLYGMEYWNMIDYIELILGGK